MKLYSVSFSTPHQAINDIVIEAESTTAAKEFFLKVLSTNQYFKVRYNDTEMIVLSSNIKVLKASIYKQAKHG